LVTTANLVNLINQDKGVLSLALLQSLNDATRKSTNVGTTVTLDLSNIGKTTDTESVVLAVQRASDGLSDTCLSDTRRTNEAKNLVPTVPRSLPTAINSRIRSLTSFKP